MTSINPTPRPQLPPGLLLGLGIGLTVVGLIIAVQYFFERQQYSQAMQAYQNADCNAAIEQFDRVIESKRLLNIENYVARAEQRKAECEYFQRAVNQQQQGIFEASLSSYITLIEVYSESALIDPARQQIAEIFQTAKVSELATLDVCKQIDLLSQRNLIPKTNTLPQFYLACGEGYEATQQYERAMTLYQQFLERHPTIQTQTMQQALASATVANLSEDGAQASDPPAYMGRTVDGLTVLEIQNSSPREMEITISGPTPKFEELEPCNDCKLYVNQGPEICPEKGPTGRYVLEPGQYQVAIDFVEQADEVIESGVGDWELIEGSEYRRCYIVVHNLNRRTEE